LRHGTVQYCFRFGDSRTFKPERVFRARPADAPEPCRRGSPEELVPNVPPIAPTLRF
jgi:hypothetical protein